MIIFIFLIVKIYKENFLNKYNEQAQIMRQRYFDNEKGK